MPKETLKLKIGYDKARSKVFHEFIKKEYPDLKCKTTPNQLHGLIFELEFLNAQDIYSFTWDWTEKYNKEFKSKKRAS